MKTEYARVSFLKSVRVFSSVGPKQGLDGKNGVRLFRVTESGRDDLVIELPANDKRDPWEVPWANVGSAQRAEAKGPARVQERIAGIDSEIAAKVSAEQLDASDERTAAQAGTSRTAPRVKRQPKAPWKNDE